MMYIATFYTHFAAQSFARKIKKLGLQGKMMSQMGIDPSALASGGMPGMGGMPGGLDMSALKGMDMKKLQELAKRFR